MYSLIRPLLFKMDPETSHNVSLAAMSAMEKCRLMGLVSSNVKPAPTTVMGIDFPNPVGLAAGLDKNGDYIDAMAALGFGFIEIGTVTPRPQSGNAKPRLFRLPEHKAIINRMGFNNKGVDYLVQQVKKATFNGVIGINIGKNKDTPNEQAVDDYLHCLHKVYAHASYVTVNLSSPNTPGLRDLQFGEPLKALLDQLKNAQRELELKHGKYVPIVLKVAPDMIEADVDDVANSLLEYHIDGLIASNTTIARDAVKGHTHAEEMGGLSGEPVRSLSTLTIQRFAQRFDNKIPIIGVGGISDKASAAEKLAAGASLLQVYSGFIYQGPQLIRDCVEAC